MPSHSAKKNVLFLMIGPPKLSVYWFLLVQSLGVGFHAPVLGSTALLLAQVLASNAVFRTDHTALPLNWLVPDRVKTCICPLPRPISASTGATIMRISPIRSGLMKVDGVIPACILRAAPLDSMPSR